MTDDEIRAKLQGLVNMSGLSAFSRTMDIPYDSLRTILNPKRVCQDGTRQRVSHTMRTVLIAAFKKWEKKNGVIA